MRIASLVILCLALAAVPAVAQWSYENGPINGTTDAWTINFGYIVSDTFVAGGNTTGFQFGVWEFPGDVLSSVDWSITTGENSGTVIGSGTASGQNLADQFISSNQYGYNIDLITVTGLNVATTTGTYWLNLQNAAVPSGDPVYWDENSGVGCKSGGCPSSASESAVGTIPGEAFTIGGGGAPTRRLSPAASCCSVLASSAWPAYCGAGCSNNINPPYRSYNSQTKTLKPERKLRLSCGDLLVDAFASHLPPTLTLASSSSYSLLGSLRDVLAFPKRESGAFSRKNRDAITADRRMMGSSRPRFMDARGSSSLLRPIFLPLHRRTL